MKKNSVEHSQKLKELLHKEREEDYRLFREQFLKASFEERKKNGLTWYPVSLRGEEPAYGDYIQVNIERTTNINDPHQFSAGKNVILFSNKNNQIKEIKATIKHVQKNSMGLIVQVDELPDWVYEGKLGVNLQFDELSYEQMDRAIDVVIKAKENRVQELREIFNGDAIPQFDKVDDTLLITNLNLSQNRAIRKAVSCKDVAVIHGPPGTGKTTTLVQTIRIVLQKENQVLVCAPTNTAVDLLTEKLTELGVKVLRLGHPARISETLLSTTIDGSVQQHVHYKEIKMLKKNAEEYFRMASKYKRSFGKEEREQRTLFYNEAKKMISEARLLEEHISSQLINESQVIACTPVISSSYLIKGKKFNTLFFDEGSQALEPMVWIPLLKCNRIIFSGDHFQLPPVVKSREAQENGLGETLFERCIKLQEASSLLTLQYRMHHCIMQFSNNYFYEGKLEADATVKETLISFNPDDYLLNNPIEYIDTAGCGFEEKQNPETLSSFNPDEINILWKHLKLLIAQYGESFNTEYFPLSVGIITPYKQQQEMIIQQLNEIDFSNEIKKNIHIKTIDGFQGEERDIIYISFVRSNNEGEIGFLSDIRRTNVAITRARKKLVMIGDSATLASHSFYRELIDYCEKNQSYKSAWEFIHTD